MRHKIAIEMIQEVVQRKDDDDEQTTVDTYKEKEPVVKKRDARMSVDDFAIARKRREKGDQAKRNSPKRRR